MRRIVLGAHDVHQRKILSKISESAPPQASLIAPMYRIRSAHVHFAYFLLHKKLHSLNSRNHRLERRERLVVESWPLIPPRVYLLVLVPLSLSALKVSDQSILTSSLHLKAHADSAMFTARKNVRPQWNTDQCSLETSVPSNLRIDGYRWLPFGDAQKCCVEYTCSAGVLSGGNGAALVHHRLFVWVRQ